MIERIYHSYDKWECYQNGMYDTTTRFMDDSSLENECVVMLSCPEWLYETMSFVTSNWFYGCEQHLTNLSRNRQAWLGQAACCLLHGAPEYITKRAWHKLTPEQQEAANKVADEVIEVWEQLHQRGYWKWQKEDWESRSCPLHKNG